MAHVHDVHQWSNGAEVNTWGDDCRDLQAGPELHEAHARGLVVLLDHPLDVADEALRDLEAVLADGHVVRPDAIDHWEEGTHVGQLPPPAWQSWR